MSAYKFDDYYADGLIFMISKSPFTLQRTFTMQEMIVHVNSCFPKDSPESPSYFGIIAFASKDDKSFAAT